MARAEDAEETNVIQKESASVSCVPGGLQRVQDPARFTEDGFNRLQSSEVTQNSTQHIEGTRSRSDPNLPQGPKPVGSGSSIVVSPRQVCMEINIIDGRS